MSPKATSAHGQRVEEILTKYEKTPSCIVQQGAEKMDMSLEGVDIPRETFFDFVSKIAGRLRIKLKDTFCVTDDGAHGLKTNIYCLAQVMAMDKVMGADVQIEDKYLATIMDIVENNRINCENCLTVPGECQKRNPDAPLDDVKKGNRGFVNR